MALGIGMDIGSISIKVAVVGEKNDEQILKSIADKKDFFKTDSLSGSSGLTIILST